MTDFAYIEVWLRLHDPRWRDALIALWRSGQPFPLLTPHWYAGPPASWLIDDDCITVECVLSTRVPVPDLPALLGYVWLLTESALRNGVVSSVHWRCGSFTGNITM